MLHKQHHTIFLLILALTLALSGCQTPVSAGEAVTAQTDAQSSDAVQTTIPEVTFTAADYRYSGPDSIPAGLTKVRLTNGGSDAHHIQLVKLEQDKSVVDLVAALQESPAWPDWAHAYGGPNAVFPGASSSALVPLDPGEYAVLSWVPDKESGAPQYERGMVKPLTVTEADAAAAVEEPATDITLELLDFSFNLSQVPAAGPQTIRVNNAGEAVHEVLLVKLPPDATVMDFVTSIGAGTLQGELAGGITAIAPGMHNTFTTTFEEGTKYGLICFVLDPESGEMHFMKGMQMAFVVE